MGGMGIANPIAHYINANQQKVINWLHERWTNLSGITVNNGER